MWAQPNSYNYPHLLFCHRMREHFLNSTKGCMNEIQNFTVKQTLKGLNQGRDGGSWFPDNWSRAANSQQEREREFWRNQPFDNYNKILLVSSFWDLNFGPLVLIYREFCLGFETQKKANNKMMMMMMKRSLRRPNLICSTTTRNLFPFLNHHLIPTKPSSSSPRPRGFSSLILLLLLILSIHPLFSLPPSYILIIISACFLSSGLFFKVRFPTPNNSNNVRVRSSSMSSSSSPSLSEKGVQFNNNNDREIILSSTDDDHGGVIVEINTPINQDFTSLLRASLSHWKQQVQYP